MSLLLLLLLLPPSLVEGGGGVDCDCWGRLVLVELLESLETDVFSLEEVEGVVAKVTVTWVLGGVTDRRELESSDKDCVEV